MSLGKQGAVQPDLMVTWRDMPRSPGHAFYDRLDAVLAAAGFDRFVEDVSAPFYAAVMGRPSMPPGRYFRMLLVGYFEGIDSERGIAWRCADSLSLRSFLGLGLTEAVPDHSTLAKTRARLSLEAHRRIFDWVVGRLAAAGLVKGKRIGVDASTMEANAAMRGITRRETGESWRQMLAKLAAESGVETPSDDELRRLDRGRKAKKVGNAEWTSPSDPEARITRMKDGRTRLAYKPEHAVDLDTGAVVAADIHRGDGGDTTTLGPTLARAEEGLAAAGVGPTLEAPAELVTDKGYHGRAVLKDLDGGPWKTRISEPKRHELLRWRGDDRARRAVYNNRARLLGGVARAAFKLRAELCERAFAHILDRGGVRRTWLRGRDNVAKRYLVHVAGFNLALLMRALTGAGTPRTAAEAATAGLRGGPIYLHADDTTLLIPFVLDPSGHPIAMAIIAITPEPSPLSTGC